MKNFLLITFVALFGAFVAAKSQSLQLVYPENPEITVVASPDSASIKFAHSIKNTTVSEQSFKISVTVESITEGHEYSLCDQNYCYPPRDESFTSDELNFLDPDAQTDEWFYLQLNPNGAEGATTLTVRFFLADDEADFVEYTITFDIRTMSVDKWGDENVSVVYPNPASGEAFVDLNGISLLQGGAIEFYDATGEFAKSIPLFASVGALEIDLSDLTPGAYYYAIVSRGEAIKRGKIIVSE